jgi:hypothetical protein
MKSVLAEKEKDKYEIYNVINEIKRKWEKEEKKGSVPVLLRMMWMASA